MILKAAYHLFSTWGYRKVSINEIAKKARVSPTTIFNYFQTKNNLMQQLVMLHAKEGIEQYKVIIYSDREYLKKLDDIFSLKLTLKTKGYWECIKEAAEEDEKLSEYLNNYYLKSVRKIIGYLIDEGIQKGYIRKKISKDIIFEYINMFRSWQAEHELEESALKGLKELFYYGLLGKDPGNG